MSVWFPTLVFRVVAGPDRSEPQSDPSRRRDLLIPAVRPMKLLRQLEAAEHMILSKEMRLRFLRRAVFCLVPSVVRI